MRKTILPDVRVGEAGHLDLENNKGTSFRDAATRTINRMILAGRMSPKTPHERKMLEAHRKQNKS
tara:strand:- start:351 stop:545 length:195 start_codon:yes stop_codon:yes gene_type:complete